MALVSRKKQGLYKKLIDLQCLITKIRVNGFELVSVLNQNRLSKECSLFKAFMFENFQEHFNIRF